MRFSGLPWLSPDEEPQLATATAVLLPDQHWHPIKPGSLRFSGSSDWLSFVESSARYRIEPGGKLVKGHGPEVRQAIPISSVLGLRFE